MMMGAATQTKSRSRAHVLRTTSHADGRRSGNISMTRPPGLPGSKRLSPSPATTPTTSTMAYTSSAHCQPA